MSWNNELPLAKNLPPRARVYVSGKLVHEIYGYRDETVEELRERANKSLLIVVAKE